MLSPEQKTALIKKRKDEKDKAESTGGSQDSKKSTTMKDDDDDDVSVLSSKSMSDLQKENARLKRINEKTKAALVTRIAEGNDKDFSLSEDRSLQRSHGSSSR